MKTISFMLLIFYSQALLAQLTDGEIHDLKSGKIKNDTSYIYWLPFECGHKFLLVQAANSKMSHKDELSLDFKMKKGSNICAAREGTVIDARGDSNQGGLKVENLNDGNYVIIRHDDESIAKYWHLQKDGVLVKIGDTVKKGQIIGISGNTGYTAFPHLHFQVVSKSGVQLLTRFQTSKGIIYLRPGKWYRALHSAL